MNTLSASVFGLGRSAWKALAVGLLAGWLAGCASPPPPPPSVRVVLLPQSDASGQPLPTAVNVTTGTQTQALDKPLAVAELDSKGQLSQRIATLEEIQARYGDVLKIQPPSPEVVVLRFVSGKSELTPESAAELPRLIALARSRAGGEILVVGHTDRVGTVEANDTLSARRAQAIADLIKAQGFSAELITAYGRGEREPAVPTADEVAEPRNRRAEVIIR
ncbi:MAG: OmpA family protein [Burkholderiaceae bacterium]|nr:OmpA family protein [Burkholderiaceae bacterium]